MKNPFKKKAPTARPLAEVVNEVQQLSVGLVQRLRAINKMNREAQQISARLDALDSELATAKEQHAKNSNPEQSKP